MRITFIPCTAAELEAQEMGTDSSTYVVVDPKYPDSRKSKARSPYSEKKTDDLLKEKIQFGADGLARVVFQQADANPDELLAMYLEESEDYGVINGGKSKESKEEKEQRKVKVLLKAMSEAFKSLVAITLFAGKNSDLGFYSKTDFRKQTKIQITFEDTLLFLQKIGSGLDEYKGMEGYLKLAEEMGGLHLGDLHQVASAMGLIKDLGWQQVGLKYEDVKIFQEKMKTQIDQYKGMEGYLKLAEEMGGVHLGILYQVASAMKLTDKLGWQKVGLKYEDVKIFQEKMDTQIDQYKGLEGYLKLAEEMGGGIWVICTEWPVPWV